MRISPEVEVAFSLATREAARRRNEYVTVEHLLLALLFDAETADVVKGSGGNVPALKKKLESYLDEELEALSEEVYDSPSLSLGFQRVVGRAASHVQSSGKEELKGRNVLVAIFAERDSAAVALLAEQGVTRFDVVNFVAHGVTKDGVDPTPEGAGGAGGDAPGPPKPEQPGPGAGAVAGC